MLSIRSRQAVTSSVDEPIGPAPWIETALPGPVAHGIIAKSKATALSSHASSYPLVVRRAKGSVVEDVDGNRFLDFAAGLAVCPTGHSNLEVSAAIADQAHYLTYMGGSSYYHPPMIDLMEKLAELAGGTEAWRVSLTSSAESAMKLAIQVARQSSGRTRVVVFHASDYSPSRSTPQACWCQPRGSKYQGWGSVTRLRYGDLEGLETFLAASRESDRPAAVLVEAWPGDSTCNIPGLSFLPKLRSMCSDHKIAMICDETETSMKRTGKWFAYQHDDVVPDIVAMARGISGGMPFGATLVRSGMVDGLVSDIINTPQSNPVCCAATLAAIRVVESGWAGQAEAVGDRMRRGLSKIAENYKCVTNVRGLGMLTSVDVVRGRTSKADPRLRDRVILESFRRGLLLMGLGRCSIRLCPPLSVNNSQVDVGLQMLSEAIATVI